MEEKLNSTWAVFAVSHWDIPFLSASLKNIVTAPMQEAAPNIGGGGGAKHFWDVPL